MGVISDAIDSLQEWCENLFKDGIGNTAQLPKKEKCDIIEIWKDK